MYNDLGEKEKALEFYNQALSLSRAVGDRADEATTLNNIGRVYYDLDENQKALDYYGQALSLKRIVGDYAGEASILNNIAHLEQRRGNLNEARTQIEAALNIIESLRTKVVNQELRTSYFASKQDYYKFYIELLVRMHQLHPSEGHVAEALHASERARARSMLEILIEAGVDIRQIMRNKRLR
jgi:tetratricopeptide (TPR) repeat protein